MNMQTMPRPDEIEAALGLSPRARRGRWAKRLAWLAVLAGIAGGGLWYYQGHNTGAVAVTYETVEAKRAALTVLVTATGTIQPTTQVDVSSELSGIVRVVLVSNNSAVKKGDVLAEIGTDRLVAEIARSEAQLKAAKARVLQALATQTESANALARKLSLRQKGLSAKQDFDIADADNARAAALVAAAQADVAVAQADLDLNKTELAKAKVLSPIDGIVLARSVEPGQTVASSFQAPVLFKIAEDLKRMQLEAAVDEADIGVVKVGQHASFTVDAYPGRSFPAEIAAIEFAPKTTDGVVTYKAILAIDNAELLLRPGMTATAQVIVNEVSGALAVPNAALRYAPPKVKEEPAFSLTKMFMPRMPRFDKATDNEADAGKSLWVLKAGAPEMRAITSGATDGKITDVTQGLVEGEAVIISSRTGTR
jgi:HlyD family secretion protein